MQAANEVPAAVVPGAVPAAAPAPGVAPPAALPFTGFGSGLTALAGWLLLSGGFVLVLLTRTPRGRHVLR